MPPITEQRFVADILTNRFNRAILEAWPRLALADAWLVAGCFLVPATSVGIRPNGSAFEVYAPYGLEGLYAGQLAPNPLVNRRALFDAKAASYRARWSWLVVTQASPCVPAGDA